MQWIFKTEVLAWLPRNHKGIQNNRENRGNKMKISSMMTFDLGEKTAVDVCAALI